VFNHVSDSHPWFLDAKKGKKPFKDWFTFVGNGEYECWRGHRHMPELVLDNEALQKVLFRGKDSVLQKYLDMGVDGWRFDVAVDVGLGGRTRDAEQLATTFPKRSLAWRSDVLSRVIGATTTRCFHGVMNYYFRDAVLGWLSGRSVRAPDESRRGRVLPRLQPRRCCSIVEHALQSRHTAPALDDSRCRRSDVSP
jgi:glycosidase